MEMNPTLHVNPVYVGGFFQGYAVFVDNPAWNPSLTSVRISNAYLKQEDADNYRKEIEATWAKHNYYINPVTVPPTILK